MTLLLLTACTFTPGQGFGELRGATLTTAFTPGAARDLGGGAFLTNQAQQVRVDRFELELGDVSLLELQGGGAVSFDPANPPPGYSLCHGGHCHADDGSLVDYSEIEAELAGDSAEWVALATWAFAEVVDLRTSTPWTLPEPAPSRLLGRGEATRLELAAGAVRLEGLASGTTPDGEDWTTPVEVDLPLPAAFGAGIELVFDRGYDPGITLDLGLLPDATFFDDLDLHALAGEESALRLDAVEDPGADDLLARFGGTEPLVSITRAP